MMLGNIPAQGGGVFSTVIATVARHTWSKAHYSQYKWQCREQSRTY